MGCNTSSITLPCRDVLNTGFIFCLYPGDTSTLAKSIDFGFLLLAVQMVVVLVCLYFHPALQDRPQRGAGDGAD